MGTRERDGQEGQGKGMREEGRGMEEKWGRDMEEIKEQRNFIRIKRIDSQDLTLLEQRTGDPPIQYLPQNFNATTNFGLLILGWSKYSHQWSCTRMSTHDLYLHLITPNKMTRSLTAYNSIKFIKLHMLPGLNRYMVMGSTTLNQEQVHNC